MSRPEGFPKPDKGTSPADDPMMDPDATRITPAGMPLDRMPPITAANRVEPRAQAPAAPAAPASPSDSAAAALPADTALPVTSSSSSTTSADASTDLDLTTTPPLTSRLPDSAASDDSTVVVPGAAFKALAAAAASPAVSQAGTPAVVPGSAPAVTPAASPAVAAQAAPVASAAPVAAPPTPVPPPSKPITRRFESPIINEPADDDDDDSEFAATHFDPSLQAEAEAAFRAATLPGGPLIPPVPVARSGAPSPQADMPVRQVGRYEIRERLGRGGMASVFKAHDPGIGRDVAIKFLHASLCEDEEYRARFLREARASGGLSHPNIVTVHDVGEIDGRPYMAMELLDGESLADVLEPGKPLPIRDVVVMSIQLARALDYSHKRGIVHRDIKPGNIARSKGTLDIKVMDFGIAHMESSKGEQRTRVGDVLGTPQYMSPEQINGEKIDGRADLFSVGIVMYQMLTGQRPFTGDSVVNLALKIAKEEPTPLNKLRPNIPASLRRVVDRCLAKAPDDRFPSGAELADALTRVLAEIDEESHAVDRPRIIPLRVKWTAMMAAIVAIVMAITCTIILDRQYGAMMQQVADSGAALTRFIAVQNATPALAEDWVTVDVLLAEMMKTRDFQSLTLSDKDNIVRASSNADAVGKAYQTPSGEVLGELGGVRRTRYLVGREPVLGFETAITYNDKVVGHVALGLPERPLESVARLSRTLMAILAVVTVLAVAIAMYVVGNWFSRPIKLMNEALGEIARGRYAFRIREQRKDEFGLLYAAFDQMAQALQDRQALTAGQSKPETIRTTAALAAAAAKGKSAGASSSSGSSAGTSTSSSGTRDGGRGSSSSKPATSIKTDRSTGSSKDSSNDRNR